MQESGQGTVRGKEGAVGTSTSNNSNCNTKSSLQALNEDAGEETMGGERGIDNGERELGVGMD